MTQDLLPGSAIPFSAPALTAGGINGLGSLRFVGTTNGGAPTSGTYNTGDVVLDLSTLLLWICTSGGTPGTWTSLSYLRTDSGAPNPQTVANPVQFASTLLAENWLGTNWNATSYPQGGLSKSSAGIYFGWNYTQGQGEGDLFIFGQGGQGGFNVYNTNASSYPTFTKLFGVDGSGDMTVAGNLSVGGTITNLHVENPWQTGYQLYAGSSYPVSSGGGSATLANTTVTSSALHRFLILEVSGYLVDCTCTYSVNGNGASNVNLSSNPQYFYIDLGTPTSSFSLNVSFWNGGQSSTTASANLYAAAEFYIVSGANGN
ncbi:hypothetical protein Alches_16270 [Alicyclobacillus hesperidum subsp. aegles]|uniref:hypothetical protein n=1 Tax=Alicyclobacillus hesperidum TaxID=89784 RepID=UPI00222B77B5|nr:hypothetical protein [Alicyclobacillus hesperidum]GLG01587.1 hypothetical protein Alches_16270 [Alicyclobacillus hesperidum subsp. aegles]